MDIGCIGPSRIAFAVLAVASPVILGWMMTPSVELPTGVGPDSRELVRRSENLRREWHAIVATARKLRIESPPERMLVRDWSGEVEALERRISDCELQLANSAHVAPLMDVSSVLARKVRLQEIHDQVSDEESNVLQRSLAYRSLSELDHSELEMTEAIERRWIEDVFLASGNGDVALQMTLSMMRLTLTPDMKDAAMRLLSHREVNVRKYTLEALERYAGDDDDWAKVFVAECRRMSRADPSETVRRKALSIEKVSR